MMRMTAMRGWLAALTAALVGCSLPTGTGYAEPPSEVFSGPMSIRNLGATTGLIPISVTGGRSTRLALFSVTDADNAITLSIDKAPTAAPLAPSGAAALRAFEDLPPRTTLTNEARLRRSLLQSAAPAEAQVGDAMKFWVIRPSVRRGAADVAVATHAVYAGTHCEVYMDDRLKGALDTQGREIGEAVDLRIFPTNSRIFGAPIPPTGSSPRIAILVSPDVNNGGRDSTIGYFTARDLLKPEDAPEVPELSKSNQRMMLYMASNIVDLAGPTEYLGTVAHEMQHLINATRKLFGPTPANTTEDTWLDEGMSMYAMEANGYGLTSDAAILLDHVKGYLRDPDEYSLTRWDLNPGQSGYGASYLFLAYLADRFGPDIVKELSGAKEVGRLNVEARLAAHGASFKQVFTDWATANMLTSDAAADPRFAYKSLQLGTTGRNAVGTARATVVAVPGGGSLGLLPWSATYLALRSATTPPAMTLDLQTTNPADVEATLVAPR